MVYQYYSCQNDEIIVLCRVDNERLMVFADICDYKMLLDADEIARRALAGDAEAGIKPFEIKFEEDVSTLQPYEWLWGEYSIEPDLQALYWRPPGYETPFRESVRLKLSLNLLEAPRHQGGGGLSLRSEKRLGRIMHYFPLHNESKLEPLTARWLVYLAWPWDQPFRDIKNYFGEKIALYFKFLGHYCSWLMVPAAFGLLCQLVVAGTGDFSHPILPFFSLFIALWAVLMLEYWKRDEKYTALRWGMIGFEDTEVDRPEFFGTEQPSYINGEMTKHFPPKQRRNLMVKSFSCIVSLALIVLGAVIAIYIIRAALYETSVATYSSVLASVMNSVQITVFNMIYSKLADYLTEMENHRTDTAFEDSMIAKLFMFQFVNSYSSFFYLAFVASYRKNPNDDDNNVGECGYSDCMIALAINLAIIFGMRLTLSNAMELGEPIIKGYFKDKKENEGAEKPVSSAEKESRLEEYDLLKGTLNDYAELSIQFGFMTFFISALPVAALGAFINNYVEIRTDAYKLVKGLRRPLPSGVEDIGTWMTIFQLIASICVITNAGLIVFTMRVLTMYSITLRLWIFIGFQWFVFTCQYVIEIIIPDEPEEVRIQELRAQHINAKLLDRVRDDDDADLAKSLASEGGGSVSFKIQDDEPESMKKDR